MPNIERNTPNISAFLTSMSEKATRGDILRVSNINVDTNGQINWVLEDSGVEHFVDKTSPCNENKKVCDRTVQILKAIEKSSEIQLKKPGSRTDTRQLVQINKATKNFLLANKQNLNPAWAKQPPMNIMDAMFEAIKSQSNDALPSEGNPNSVKAKERTLSISGYWYISGTSDTDNEEDVKATGTQQNSPPPLVEGNKPSPAASSTKETSSKEDVDDDFMYRDELDTVLLQIANKQGKNTQQNSPPPLVEGNKPSSAASSTKETSSKEDVDDDFMYRDELDTVLLQIANKQGKNTQQNSPPPLVEGNKPSSAASSTKETSSKEDVDDDFMYRDELDTVLLQIANKQGKNTQQNSPPPLVEGNKPSSAASSTKETSSKEDVDDDFMSQDKTDEYLQRFNDPEFEAYFRRYQALMHPSQIKHKRLAFDHLAKPVLTTEKATGTQQNSPLPLVEGNKQSSAASGIKETSSKEDDDDDDDFMSQYDIDKVYQEIEMMKQEKNTQQIDSKL